MKLKEPQHVMMNFNTDEERTKDKVNLLLKVNYVSSIIAIAFGFVSFFIFDITQVIPHFLIGFGVLNLANTLVFKKHQSLTTTYNISSVLALVSSTDLLFKG